MEEQYKLNDEATMLIAKELTIIAMQNNLVRIETDTKASATNVTDFYKKIIETINKD